MLNDIRLALRTLPRMPGFSLAFILTLGLGIGAMYVRSMTIMLVDKGTLAEYRYLEHGAFYAILILSVIMYCQTLVHIPEVITGLGGAGLIGISLWSSIRYNRREEAVAHDARPIDRD